MSNRSHFNAGHRAMNRLGRDGQAHSSAINRPKLPTKTKHKIIIGDAVDMLAKFKSESVDLIICDPPYNLDLADWDKIPRYLDWAKNWLEHCIRVLKSTGNIVIFGGFQFQSEVGGDLLEIMHFLRHSSPLRLVNLIVWNYPNGMSAHRFFANRHEEIAWYTKSAQYVFDLDAVREPYDEETKLRYRRDKRLRPESLEKGKNPTNVWRIGRLGAKSKERTGHPTQKPRAIIERIIRGLSFPGQTVLDPFAGTGVTTRMAIELARNSLSIDRSPSLHEHLGKQLEDLSSPSVPYKIESLIRV